MTSAASAAATLPRPACAARPIDRAAVSALAGSRDPSTTSTAAARRRLARPSPSLPVPPMMATRPEKPPGSGRREPGSELSATGLRAGNRQAIRIAWEPPCRGRDRLASNPADELRIALEVVEPKPKQLDIGQHLRNAGVALQAYRLRPDEKVPRIGQFGVLRPVVLKPADLPEDPLNGGLFVGRVDAR